MMQESTAFIGIGSAIAIGAMSPGPSFVMVARTAVSASRAAGLSAALGMGTGGLFFATASLLGLQALLLAVPSFYWVLKFLGGLYLAYLGVRIWLGAKKALPEASAQSAAGETSAMRSLLLGLSTQVSNPKAAIVYATVFAAFLPASASLGFKAAVAAMVFCVETSWYAVVALVLSSSRPRAAYLRYKAWIDRLAGGVMIALGLKLAASAGVR
jgi:threonine/homoserine/homoserine lactone efflux protein